MKYILNHKHFESLQQAEKIIKDNNIDKQSAESLIEEFQKLGLSNYLGYCFQLIKNDDNQIKDIKKFTDTFTKIKQHKINVNDITIGMSGADDIYDLENIISNKIKEKTLHSFINKWCPANLRDEVKSNLKDYKFFYYDRYFYNFNHLSKDKQEMLKKGSRYKTATQWLQYLKITLESHKFTIQELKDANIKSIHEDDKYLIYQPLDYQTYMIPRFQFWCTMQEIMFQQYLRLNMLIILDKNDKSESYFTYWANDKINVSDYKNNNIGIKNIPQELKPIIEKYYLNSALSRSSILNPMI